MKKTIVALLLIASVLLVSCGGQKEEMASDEPMITGAYAPGQTETAYGFTHGGYIGMAKVMTDDNGDLSVEIDEAFLPHTLAIVSLEDEKWNEDNTVTYVGRRPTTVAKYVGYNGKVYVAGLVGQTLIFVEADEEGNPKGGADLETSIYRNQATMAAYYNLVQAGQFSLYTEFGGDAMAVKTTSYGGVTKKNAPDYWGGADRKTTWMSNIKAIEEFIAENGVQFSESAMKRATEEDAEGLKKWSVADAVTGATNSDFKDYFGLAQHAAGKLKTN